MLLNSWGNLYKSQCDIEILDKYKLDNIVKIESKILAQGKARSYGDVCLNSHQTIINTSTLNLLRKFDEETGILVCESGVLLKDIQDTFISRGWILAVTPGTQLITVGGAIANDIHGKNHHIRGNFGHHVLELILLRSTGEVVRCSRQKNCELFYATLGGIGLTGIIISVKIQLLRINSPFLNVEYIPFRGVSEFIQLNSNSEHDWEYTVSWIDCLSGKNVRGIFIRANHCVCESIEFKDKIKNKKIPFKPPYSLINKASLKAFNEVYYHLNASKYGKKYIEHFYNFQYPLDKIENWNVLYGKKGFYQYQCVIPLEFAEHAIESLLEKIQFAQQGSFLVVLKAFGRIKSEGILSFPMEGITLALDFPNQGTSTLDLLFCLDKIVLENSGRLYLAKDARMEQKFFMQTYPLAKEFMKFRDPFFSSDMSRRLFGE